MVNSAPAWVAAATIALAASLANAQQAGSIRGRVIDRDFDAPLPFAEVSISETGARTTATAEGNYVFGEVPAGRYTLIFSKEGFARQVRSDVVVSEGRLVEVDASLTGDFLELEEFVVQELQVGGGSEIGLLRLRMESPALMDSIGQQLISRSGASDAAGALRLVPGATVVDGFAVVRGLPDRYVSSQLNGVRLPTADEDKRGVELDQFPSAVIESLQVSKTFTPDQQGDASGGAVDLILKGIPAETILQFKAQAGYNTQTTGRRDFLTYQGGGLTYWGNGRGAGPPQENGTSWTGAVGTSATGTAPPDYKWSVDAGTRLELDDDVVIGGFTSFFYEDVYEYYDDGVDDSLWVVNPGDPMTPESIQGTPNDGDFKTALYDVTKGAQEVQWSWLATGGIEIGEQSLGVTYLYTRTATDVATLAEDTRGKSYYFPDYDVNDPADPGNSPGNRTFAPWNRTETLEYTDRTTSTLILNGDHVLPFLEDVEFGPFLFQRPELDWSWTTASATKDQPDKRQFGSLYLPESLNPGFPPFLPPFVEPELQVPYKPDANFTLGNVQHLYKTIKEDTTQASVNLLLPFEQWTGDEGFLKFGIFNDDLHRTYDQESYSNFNDNSAQYQAPWEDLWSAVFPDEDHPISDGPPFVDVDYEGRQKIFAWYAMADVPLDSWIKLIGGARVESIDLAIQNFPEADATWFPPGSIAPVKLNPGDADVDLSKDTVLPSIAFEIVPVENLTFRGSYAQTIALPTFKELTPILQQEYLGGDIFIGNPDIVISDVKNYDLRLDWTPYLGGLVSASWFHKDIVNPIEYVQRVTGFTYTTPVNYPKGTISGWEVEVRQDLGYFTDALTGLLLGANATLIDSNVVLPEDEAMAFAGPAIDVPITSRQMTDAPEYLYNLFMTYDIPETGTQIGVFYNFTGDTLIAGAGQSDGNFVPSVFQKAYGILNFTLSQEISEWLKLTFQAKNLTNPTYREVYAGPGVDGEYLKRSFSLGIDLSLSLTARFTF
jgi:outer membrane receptor protein involved in Fe transport